MDSLFERGRRAWPTIALERDVFARRVEAHAADEDPAEVRAEDLYLACACEQGDARALAEFEAHYLAQVPSFLARTSPSDRFVDDVRQQLRERLFVARKIGQYSGRGTLSSWLRVVTVRVAANLRRAERPPALEEVIPARVVSPELAVMQRRYGEPFRVALRDAIAGLAPDERSLLRLQYVDGLNIDRIAIVFGVSRATIGRRMIAVRERVLQETHRLLGERLRATPDELRSLVRLLRSQLAVSLSALLRDP